jgi:cobalamin biosynthesis protein CbiD
MENSDKKTCEINIDDKITVGENIVNLANVAEMNKDNKDMLKKVSSAKTTEEAFSMLLNDPNTGKSVSYMESRMRWG